MLPRKRYRLLFVNTAKKQGNQRLVGSRISCTELSHQPQELKLPILALTPIAGQDF